MEYFKDVSVKRSAKYFLFLRRSPHLGKVSRCKLVSFNRVIGGLLKCCLGVTFGKEFPNFAALSRYFLF